MKQLDIIRDSSRANLRRNVALGVGAVLLSGLLDSCVFDTGSPSPDGTLAMQKAFPHNTIKINPVFPNEQLMLVQYPIAGQQRKEALYTTNGGIDWQKVPAPDSPVFNKAVMSYMTKSVISLTFAPPTAHDQGNPVQVFEVTYAAGPVIDARVYQMAPTINKSLQGGTEAVSSSVATPSHGEWTEDVVSGVRTYTVGYGKDPGATIRAAESFAALT